MAGGLPAWVGDVGDAWALDDAPRAARPRGGLELLEVSGPLRVTIEHDAADLFIPVSSSFLASLPPRVGLPELPNNPTSEQLNTYFEQLAARSLATVKAQNDATEKDFRATAAYLKDFGWYGKAAYDFLVFWYKVGRKVGEILYGKPDWNDPKWIEHAIVQQQNIANNGFAGFPPFTNAVDHSTDDYAIDWASQSDRVVRDLAAFTSRHPGQSKALQAAMAWARARATTDRRIVDLVQADVPLWGARMSLFPVPLLPTGLNRVTVSALGRVLAYAYGKDPKWASERALAIYFAFYDAALNLKDEEGTPYRLGSPYTTADQLSRIVDELPKLPSASGPSLSSGTPSSSSSSSSGGGPAAAVAVGGAALLALLLL